ncbi:hypothetical protein BGZ65_007673, partial [Modicella reniformis]
DEATRKLDGLEFVGAPGLRPMSGLVSSIPRQNTVAIKIINKNKVVNQHKFAQAKREIQYPKLLRHPHNIKL